MSTVAHYLTVPEIAARLNVPMHRVRWVIRTRPIAHVVEVGSWPGFDEAAVTLIRAAIDEIAARR